MEKELTPEQWDMVLNFDPLVRKFANQYAVLDRCGMEFDDYYGIGMTVLIDIVQRYYYEHSLDRLTNWIHIFVTKTMSTHQRDETERHKLEQPMIEELIGFQVNYPDPYQTQILNDCIDKLSPMHKTVIKQFLADESLKDLCLVFDCPLSTIYNKLDEATRRLKQLLEAKGIYNV
jgi:RNA polymerase sigma factor (sigma-70 family)